MTLPERIAAVLAPHLGSYSADAVARHICAKYGIDGGIEPEGIDKLQEFLRRGLVAYVGAETADSLAAECVSLAVEAREPRS